MSEKRKPSIKISAEYLGNEDNHRVKIELFKAELFPDLFNHRQSGRYRVRINGKWARGGHTFTLSNVVSQLRQFLTRHKG